MMPFFKRVLQMKHDNSQQEYYSDLKWAQSNWTKIQKNNNLLFWYKELYSEIFSNFKDFEKLSVLELGGGTSPVKKFFPHVVTADIMSLEHVDHCVDIYNISSYEGFSDKNFDLILMINTFHHLSEPILALNEIAKKLNTGGAIIMVDPFFSLLSSFIYKNFHHEKIDFTVEKPFIDVTSGPLTASNMAIPHKIFFIEKKWMEEIKITFNILNIKYFSSLSYMATGGVSRIIPFFHPAYKKFFRFDSYVAKRFPKVFASFFYVHLVKK